MRPPRLVRPLEEPHYRRRMRVILALQILCYFAILGSGAAILHDWGKANGWW